MGYLVCADIFQTLGLGWEKILLYLANFAILFVGLTFLLYKPIKKFMAKRKEEIATEVSAAEKIRKEAEEIKKQGEETAKNAEETAKNLIIENEKAKKDALQEREAMLAEARKEAEKIVRDAEKDALDERKKAVEGAKSDVADLAITIAREILGREISEEDNEKIIDDCIKDWKEND